MALLTSPGVNIQPSSEQVPLSTNYINNFDFLNQYLPDIYEQEFARYGNQSIGAFLRHMSAELPFDSDLIKWSEEGRLFTKYVDVDTDAALGDNEATFTINDTLVPGSGSIALRKGETIFVYANDGTGSNKAIITDVDTNAGTIDVAYYESAGQAFAVTATVSLFVTGSEFKKGVTGMEGSIEASPDIFENSPIIIKDKYAVSGSDMAQIGWIKTPQGYYWFMTSENRTRQRYDAKLEMELIEGKLAGAGSGVATQTTYANAGNKGTEGLFYAVNSRGNVWAAGNPTTLADWDTVVGRLDKQGQIMENAVFCNRDFSLDIDDMLAAQNSYGAGGTSYGLFDNSEQMALTLGFTGFRRGTYYFYKTDWRYLNDPTLRGDMPAGVGSGKVNGMLVPAGTKQVRDNAEGKDVSRPFLHVRYRQGGGVDRRYQTWLTGSQGGANTSDLDAMEVNYLSERALCVLGANNFMMFNS